MISPSNEINNCYDINFLVLNMNQHLGPVNKGKLDKKSNPIIPWWLPVPAALQTLTKDAPMFHIVQQNRLGPDKGRNKVMDMHSACNNIKSFKDNIQEES